MKQLYAVLRMIKKTNSTHNQEIHLVDDNTGVIGVLPIFTDKEKAEDYADGRYELVKLEMGEE